MKGGAGKCGFRRLDEIKRGGGGFSISGFGGMNWVGTEGEGEMRDVGRLDWGVLGLDSLD